MRTVQPSPGMRGLLPADLASQSCASAYVMALSISESGCRCLVTGRLPTGCRTDYRALSTDNVMSAQNGFADQRRGETASVASAC